MKIGEKTSLQNPIPPHVSAVPEREELSVSTEIYEQLVRALIEKAGQRSYFSGHVTVMDGGVEYRLVVSVIFYHEKERWPEGEQAMISDMVPVWWECHTVNNEGGEVANDFSFSRLRELLPLFIG